jgi:hypothetical protein
MVNLCHLLWTDTRDHVIIIIIIIIIITIVLHNGVPKFV